MTQRRLARGELSFKNFESVDANFDDVWDVWAVSASNFTLQSQTAAQQLLNASPNGALTLDVGVYAFECSFALSSMSASSGDFGFKLGGSATIGSQAWEASAARVAALATGATGTPQTFTYNTAASTTLGGASTQTNGIAYIEGTFTVTAKGTIIPQVSLGVAAAAVIQAGASFWLKKISNNSNATTVAPPAQSSLATVPSWS